MLTPASRPCHCRDGALTPAEFVEPLQEEVGGLCFSCNLNREDVSQELWQPPRPIQRCYQNRASTGSEETWGTARPCCGHLSQ